MKEDNIIKSGTGKIYCGQSIMQPPPKSTIIIGDGCYNWCIGVDKNLIGFKRK